MTSYTCIGKLRCWAKNRIGMQREPCVFVVTKAGPPTPLANCSVTNKTTTSLTIECIPGDNGGSKQHFHAHVFQVDSEEGSPENHFFSDESLQTQSKMNLTSEKSPTFYLSSLNPGTSYMVELYASNARGQSDRSRLSVTTLFTKNTKLSKLMDSATDTNSLCGSIELIAGDRRPHLQLCHRCLYYCLFLPCGHFSCDLPSAQTKKTKTN